jgi:DNA-binding NtrC family response regulator
MIAFPEARLFDGIPANRKLDGMRVLIVEDEYFIADELRRLLAAQGAEVLGPASDISDAAAILAGSEADCAVLDIDLNGRAVFPILDLLKHRGIPWVYVTGYTNSLVPESMHGRAHIEKPIVAEALVAALTGLQH